MPLLPTLGTLGKLYVVLNREKNTVTTPTRGRRILPVDERGRISLAKYGMKNMDVVVEKLPSGQGVTIQPAVVLTEAEAAHFGSPEAIETLARGLADARAGRTSKMPLRSDS